MMPTSFVRVRHACMFVVVAIALCGPRASAINIILDYEPQNNSEDPNFDADGAKLIAVMQAAAAPLGIDHPRRSRHHDPFLVRRSGRFHHRPSG